MKQYKEQIKKLRSSSIRYKAKNLIESCTIARDLYRYNSPGFIS